MPVELDHPWQTRSPQRLSEDDWQATMARVRGEFEEMPCLRVTPEQARALFGLSSPGADWILNRLTEDGFLVQTSQGH
jgi:hypothetical protein